MLFNDAEAYIKCCYTITDNNVFEALDALTMARALFEHKELTNIPERINICLTNGSIVYTIRNIQGINDSYNCYCVSWWKSNICLGILSAVVIGLVAKYIL
jgi:hypothetical protein